MPRYSFDTKLDPEEAIDKAAAYFGEGGLGLDMIEEGPCCLFFEGGGGHIRVMAVRGEEEAKTTVELETREWDYHVKRFMGQMSSGAFSGPQTETRQRPTEDQLWRPHI